MDIDIETTVRVPCEGIDEQVLADAVFEVVGDTYGADPLFAMARDGMTAEVSITHDAITTGRSPLDLPAIMAELLLDLRGEAKPVEIPIDGAALAIHEALGRRLGETSYSGVARRLGVSVSTYTGWVARDTPAGIGKLIEALQRNGGRVLVA